MAWRDKQKVRYRARIVRRMAILMLHDFSSGIAASLFAYEGAFVAEIRSSLCLAGWPWSIADRAARDLVAEALCRINAKRPSWNEGQREWTVQAGTLIERTRCVTCHSALPEGHKKFCGKLCANRWHKRLDNRRAANEDNAICLTIRSI
tara:strand:- start:621 stop:1067 length:447 start_codon:yes stop_codon:yes gene_type:complete